MLVRCIYYYEYVKDDSEVEERLRWYGEKLPARGFPEYFKRIRQEGLVWTTKSSPGVQESWKGPEKEDEAKDTKSG